MCLWDTTERINVLLRSLLLNCYQLWKKVFLIFSDSEGIVEDVILLGAPVSGCAEDWSPFEKIVAGRIVNGYCR